MSAPTSGLDVTVERGVATIRATPLAGEGKPGRAGDRSLGDQALAQLASIGTKGVRGLVVDLTSAGATDGAAHVALADAFGPLLAAWEARGLAVAVVAHKGRAQLEAARVVAQRAPRWGRAVGTIEDAERGVGAK